MRQFAIKEDIDSGMRSVVSSDGIVGIPQTDRVLLWDRHASEFLQPVVPSTETSFTCVAFSPDGKKLAVGTRNGSLTLWNLDKPRRPCSLPGHEGPVTCIAFTSDGTRIASGGDDGRVRLSSVTRGSLRDTLNKCEKAIICLAFAPDGSTLAFGDSTGNIKLWDLSSRAMACQLGRHRMRANSLVFLDEGKTLVSAGWDRMVLFWDLLTKQHKLRVKHRWSIDRGGIAYFSDRRLMVSRDRGGTVRLWRAATEAEVQASGWYESE